MRQPRASTRIYCSHNWPSGGRVKRWILAQDSPLHVPQALGRFNAAKLHQNLASILVCLQGFCLASRLVKRQHQQLPYSLVQRSQRHQPTDFTDEYPIGASQANLRFDSTELRRDPLVLQLPDKLDSEAFTPKVRKRITSP